MSDGSGGQPDAEAERSEAKAADRPGSSHIRSILDAVEQPVVCVDPSGIVTATNDPAESILGVQAGESVDSVFALDGLEDSDDESDPVEQLRTVPDRGLPIRTTDGDVLRTTPSTSPLDSGGIACTFPAIEHAGETAGTRESQSDTEALPSSDAGDEGERIDLPDAIADPVYVLDNGGTIERVNDAMPTYTGYDRSELLDRSIGEIIPAREYDRVTNRLVELAADGTDRSETFETAVVTKDGDVKLTEANITVLTDSDGTYRGSVGVLRDIGQRKQRERDLELLKQVLTRLFRHNVRNDLNIIRGHADMIRSIGTDGAVIDDTLPERIETFADQIVETADQLLDHSEKARLIEQVIETDSTVETDLSAAVDDVVTTVRTEHPDAEISVDLEATGVVRAHPEIRTAIEELVGNAIEHAPDGDTPRVNIRTDETDTYLTLFVEDESGGLDDHEIDVLRRGTEEDLAHSSGVGLWLVRWIVEYSDANMIVHRTDDGSLMGIRFAHPEAIDPESVTTSVDPESPFTRLPEYLRNDVEPERIHGETVVGRGEELHRLEEIYESLEHKGGHAVLITGESGVGKTTLVERFRERIERQHEKVIFASGTCSSGVTRPYHVFRDLLDDLPSTTSLEALFEGTGGPVDDDDPEAVENQRTALFESIADELRAVASDRPVVLVAEDLQWADSGSIALWEYLVEEVGQWAPPIMFVGTYRDAAVSETDLVREVTERTSDTGRGTIIDLQPFAPSDVADLLSYMLDVDEPPEPLAEEIHDRTGGRPSFVVEIGRQIVETVGSSPSKHALPSDLDGLSIPETVERAVIDRIESLPEPVRSVLELGAVVGETVPFDLLRAASHLPETVLVEYVDRLVEQRIWKRTDSGLTFEQGLFRTLATEEMDDQRRSELHRTVAEAIEQVYADSLDDWTGRLAEHYLHAGDASKAYDLFCEAGDRAIDAYAFRDGIEAYDQAIHVARDEGVASSEAIADLYADLADACRSIGQFECARSAIKDGFNCASDDSVTQCRLLGLQADVDVAQSDYDRAEATTKRQQELAESLGASTYESDALRRLGLIARNRSEFSIAQDYFETCLSIAESEDDRETATLVRKELGTIALRQSQYDRARSHYERSLSTAREINAINVESACYTNLGAVLYREGEYEGAVEHFQRALSIKREIGDDSGAATCLSNLGLIAEIEGEYDSAEAYFEESLAMRRDIGDRQGVSATLNLLAIVLLRRGAYDRGLELIEESIDIARDVDQRLQLVWCLLSRSELLRRMDRFDEARRMAHEAVDHLEEVDSPDTEVDAYRELGAIDRTDGSFDDAWDHVQTAMDRTNEGGDPQSTARVHLEAARIELATEDLETARQHAETARGTFEDLGSSHFIARCRVVQGTIEAAASNDGQARKHFDAALDTFLAVDAPQDTLDVIRHRLSLTHDEDLAGDLRKRAMDVYESAPDPVRRHYESWIESL